MSEISDMCQFLKTDIDFLRLHRAGARFIYESSII